MTAEFVHLDGTRVAEKIIGVGRTGIVIQQGLYVLKIPRLSRNSESTESLWWTKVEPPKKAITIYGLIVLAYQSVSGLSIKD